MSGEKFAEYELGGVIAGGTAPSRQAPRLWRGLPAPVSYTVSQPSADGESVEIKLLTRQVEDLRQERD